MTDVHVDINGILLYCDESVAELNLGNGYSLTKTKIDDIPFKGHITDGNGQLRIEYLGSRINGIDGEEYLMRLHKETTYPIQTPQLVGRRRFTVDDLFCADQLNQYKDAEVRFLYDVFVLLRLFKKGNVGTKEVFFEHRITMLENFCHTEKQTSNNVDKNITNTTFLSLSPDEIDECNRFLLRVSSAEFAMMRDCIYEFAWGQEQVDQPTGFEQFTTALEMLFLITNEQGKKECLAKRLSALLETDDTQILALYNKVKVFYRFRSESLHDGDGSNISATEIEELEEIVRRSLKKYLDFCMTEIVINPNVTWTEIKTKKIDSLKSAVIDLKNRGVFPS